MNAPEVLQQRLEAASRVKENLHLSKRLNRYVNKAIACSDALDIQEKGWSKRDSKPSGTLREGWLKELEECAEEAAFLSAQSDYYNLAAGLEVGIPKNEEGKPLFMSNTEAREVSGIVEGKEVRLWNVLFAGFNLTVGTVDGVSISGETAHNVWLKVGSPAVAIEAEIAYMNSKGSY